MNKMFLALALLACLTIPNEAFLLVSPSLRPAATPLFSSPSEGTSSEEDGLILDMDKVQQQMGKLKSKYPTAEADYLAAARKRAELKVESQNNLSTDDDWKHAAQEKLGGSMDKDDGWEASLKEAGNEESQMLIPNIELDIGQEGGEGGGDDEPKLLL